MRKILSYHFIGYLTLIVVALLTNIALKYGDNPSYFRYFVKSIVPALILHYFLTKINNYKRESVILVIAGILLFFTGDLFFLDRYSVFSFNIAILMLIFAKICFVVRFLNHKDFKIIHILPFLIFCSLYMLLIFTAIINNLKSIYFVQVLVYLFVTLLFGLFTYLRYKAVNRTSFILVLIGFLLMLIVDGLTALNMFSPKFEYNLISSTIIALAFNLSQFFIVAGLIKENPETT